MAKLKWRKVGKDHWETEERLNGEPDFVIRRSGQPTPGYRVKMRSAARQTWCGTLAEAKEYAESVWSSTPEPGTTTTTRQEHS